MNNIDIINNKLYTKNLIYNSYNQLISFKDLYLIFNKYNLFVKLTYSHLSIFQNAFVHSSYCYRDISENINLMICPSNSLKLFENSFERLEFLGDSILKTIISSYLYFKYQKADEGILTKMKFKLEDREQFSYFSKKLKLNNFLIISKKLEIDNQRFSKKILEDLFESFIGATYCSFGFEFTNKFVVNIIETEVDFNIFFIDDNYKAQLTYYCQKMKYNLPIYINLDNDKNLFVIGIRDLKNKDGDFIAYGKSPLTKQKAEQQCAKNVLIYYNEIKE